MHVRETLHLFIKSLPLAMTPKGTALTRPRREDRASPISTDPQIHPHGRRTKPQDKTRSPLIKASLALNSADRLEEIVEIPARSVVTLGFVHRHLDPTDFIPSRLLPRCFRQAS
jgi:hypothetical protein